MKPKFFIAATAVALCAVFVFSQIETKRFAPAEDLPREALVYVQINDLPAFFKVWNESDFRKKYEASENYDDFLSGHLGLKILSRWDEFDRAAGFPFDLETVSEAANDQAAIAVYDIGKLEFVFVAPVAAEIFAATKFARNREKFDEETLPDGTAIFRAPVEADRGRQKQELIFTHAKNRFVLATSEKLLMQTLNNINGAPEKNRLIDAPDFKVLSERAAAHTATVWVNQTALNDDYYFKRYWLWSDARDLKNIRAGMFDFEMREEKLIETRRFLLREPVNRPPIDERQAAETLAFLPANVPFYKLQAADPKAVGAALEATIDERRDASETDARQNDFTVPDGYTSEDYEYLGEQFDETIDDVPDPETVHEAAQDFDLANSLQTAAPQTILTFAATRTLPAPRFVEFRRAAVFRLAAASRFDRARFESAIEKTLAARILVHAPNVNFRWESKTENGAARRELNLPMLGRTIVYATRGSNLILSNDADFLRDILAERLAAKAEDADQTFSELTALNLEQRKTAFDEVFAAISRDAAEKNFFTGNISSLLDALADVKRIEIRKKYAQNFYEEELIFALQ